MKLLSFSTIHTFIMYCSPVAEVDSKSSFKIIPMAAENMSKSLSLGIDPDLWHCLCVLMATALRADEWKSAIRAAFRYKNTCLLYKLINLAKL